MGHHLLTVSGGCRAVFYDESVYPSPSTYDPERFLKDGKLDGSVIDPEDRIFGSGRRYIRFHCHISSNPFNRLSQNVSWKALRAPNAVPQHIAHPRHV